MLKITKYPQSCALIEEGDRRILIDSGNFVAEKYNFEDFLPLDGVLVTHLHEDHADKGLLRGFQDRGIRLIANQATAEYLPELDFEVVEDGQEFVVGDFQVRVHELPHCLMVDGSAGPQNSGFIINDKFFHPGDGVETDGVKVEVVAVPIAGPDVSSHDAFKFIQSVGARVAIPVHYDFFLNDPEFFKQMVGKFDGAIDVIVLADGESTHI